MLLFFEFKGCADMLRKYVMDMVPLVGLLKYVTDFQKITSGEIVKNVKYVTKSLSLKIFVTSVMKTYEKSFQNTEILQFFSHDGRTDKIIT